MSVERPLTLVRMFFSLFCAKKPGDKPYTGLRYPDKGQILTKEHHSINNAMWYDSREIPRSLTLFGINSLIMIVIVLFFQTKELNNNV